MSGTRERARRRCPRPARRRGRRVTTASWRSWPRPSGCWRSSRSSAISVDDLARGAGISRPTFYFYFPSKDAVLLTLLDRVVAEADAGRGAAFDAPAADPREAWERAITAYYETFRAHRSLTLAWAEARSTNDEVRALWAAVFERWVQRSARPRSRRSAPAAPPGRACRRADLAIALNSMNERVLYATFSGDGPAVAEDDVVAVLLDVWLSAIYGATTHVT